VVDAPTREAPWLMHRRAQRRVSRMHARSVMSAE
jgi:hypothetical protein